ncbi:unnamed protein product [Peniophora sp. CBMAI 1063]|nr:unnamed protein product [Peniophora sp. CBMAI 1063]
MSLPARKRSLPAEIPQARQKQARTSQTCGPCRARVSRCDKQRPCSSCILANTQTQCYPDAASYQPPPSHLVSRALSRRDSQTHRILGAPMGRRGSSGQQLYEGPTAVLMTLASLHDESPEVPPAELAPERIRKPYRPDKDLDVVSQLPPRDVCERVVDYYFEHCTWLYKYFDRRAFAERLSRWRTDEETDSLTLAGIAIICAIVVHCLPPHHELASTLKVFPDYKPLPPGANEKDIQSARERAHADSSVNRAGVISAQFYDACELALEREKAGSKVHVWTMDFLEVVLGKCHYLGLSRVDTEELWALRGELVSMATALGLHRYPGKNVPHLVAERHRWIWGNIIFLERWQALMHGRPLSILPEHFDVALPSPAPISLPQTSHELGAHFSLDLSHDLSAGPSTQEQDGRLMASLSRHGRTDSMPNISRLGLHSIEPSAEPSFAPSVGGPSLEGWVPAADPSGSIDASTTANVPASNPFALSLDPNSLLLDPAQEAQMFGSLPALPGISEDVAEAGSHPTWDFGEGDLSSWYAILNQSPSASGNGQEEDYGKILRALPGPEECGTRTYEAHIAHFQLVHILGRITEALLSLRPVAYTRIQARDDELQHFMDTLAPSLKLPAEDIVQLLISQHTGLRRQGVQALVVQMAALHIRFMLHRPYACGEVEDWPTPPPQDSSTAKGQQSEVDAYLETQRQKEYRRKVRVHADEHATSLAQAIQAAQGLIELAVVTVPKMTHANACAEHAHLNWAPVQVTAAALFLINVVATSPIPQAENERKINPTIPQPISASSSISSNSDLSYPSLNAFTLLHIIRRALRFLQEIAYMSTAHNSASLLQHLEPLFTESFIRSSTKERAKIKRETLMNVERLNMPYRDGGTVGIVGGVSPPGPPQMVGSGIHSQVQGTNASASILKDTRRSSDAGVSSAKSTDDRTIGARPTPPARRSSLHDPPPRISTANAMRARVHFAPEPPRTGTIYVMSPSTTSRGPKVEGETTSSPMTASTTSIPEHVSLAQPANSQSVPQSSVHSPSQAQAQDILREQELSTVPATLSSPSTMAVSAPAVKSFVPGITPYPTLNAPPAISAAPLPGPPQPSSAYPTSAPPSSSSQPPHIYAQNTSAMPRHPPLPFQSQQSQALPPPYHRYPIPPSSTTPFTQPHQQSPPVGLPPTSSAFSNLSQSLQQRDPSSSVQYAPNLMGPPSAGGHVPPPAAPLSGYAIFSGYPNSQAPPQYHQPPVASSAAEHPQGGRLGYPPGFNMNNVYGASGPMKNASTAHSPSTSNAPSSLNAPAPAPPSQVAPPPPQADANSQDYGSAMWIPHPPPMINMAPNPAPPNSGGDASGSSFWTNMIGQRVGSYAQPNGPASQPGYGPQNQQQWPPTYAQPWAQAQGTPVPPPGQQAVASYQGGYAQSGYPPGQMMYGQPGVHMFGPQGAPYGGTGPPSAPGIQPTYGQPPTQTPSPYTQPVSYGQPGAYYGQPPGAYGQALQYQGGVAYQGSMGSNPPNQSSSTNIMPSAANDGPVPTFDGQHHAPLAQQQQHHYDSGGQQ